GIAPHELYIGACGPRELPALARLHLDIVNDGADGDVAHRHGIARLHVDALARHDFVAGLEALRCQDIRELAVVVLDERDEPAAVRIVLEAYDLGGHIALGALEVDDAEAALVPAAAPAHGDVAMIIPATLLALALGQRLHRRALPELAAVDDHQLALARRDRLEGLECHPLRFPSSRRSSSPRRG